MTIMPYTDIMDELISFVLAQEKSAAKVYRSYHKDKGFDPARLFAKNQAEAIFQVTRDLRRMIQNWDEATGDPTLQMYYPDQQPTIDANIQLVQ